jgi:hypothetical protein
LPVAPKKQISPDFFASIKPGMPALIVIDEAAVRAREYFPTGLDIESTASRRFC